MGAVCVQCVGGWDGGVCVCVKEVASKRRCSQGWGLSEGRLSKNSTHMPLCVVAVLWPDRSALLHREIDAPLGKDNVLYDCLCQGGWPVHTICANVCVRESVTE